MHKKIKWIAVVFVLILCARTQAHRPIFTEEKGIDAESAVRINKPQVSQVIYRELVDKRPQLWLTFEAEEEFDLFVQLGIPVIDRLKDFRPSFVVLGPDLPDVSLPFAVPEGLGGICFSTAEVEEPRFFHEHFTGTDSWILRSETVPLPSKGRYYVVAYSPENEKGKLWLSVGKKEQFGLLDWLSFGEWKRRIQAFHEVGLGVADPGVDDRCDSSDGLWPPLSLLLSAQRQVCAESFQTHARRVCRRGRIWRGRQRQPCMLGDSLTRV